MRKRRKCSKCNVVKNESEFYIDYRTGHPQSWCKYCKVKYNLLWKKTPVGKACTRRYREGKAGKAAARRYKNGPACKAAAMRWLQSAKCVEYEKRRSRSPVRMKSKKISKQRIRRDALLIVGRGKIKCVACPVRDPNLLDINHLNGDGALDEKKYGVKGLEYAIVSGRRKIDDLDLRCKNCHWEYDRNRREKLLCGPPASAKDVGVIVPSEIGAAALQRLGLGSD